MVDLILQEGREEGQGCFAGRQVAVYQGYGKGSDFLHVRVNCGEERPYMVFFVRNLDRRTYAPGEHMSQGWGGNVLQIKDAVPFVELEDYGWVTVHIDPMDTAYFRGFIRS